MTDCPGGVCPVPWATDTSGDDKPSSAWNNYIEKHKEIFTNRSEWNERFPPVLTNNVNHPEHYTIGSVECIEAIEAQLTLEEYRGYLKGNVAKYVWREKNKGGIESLKKAQWYLDRLINLE